MNTIVKDSAKAEHNVSQGQITYQVIEIRKSESAFVIFAEQEDGERQKVVLKILRNYADERYQLSQVNRRFTCQCEALRRNQKINTGIYKGLAPLLEPDLEALEEMIQQRRLQSITIGRVRDSKHLGSLCKQKVDCALVMSRLPEERRLDYLLHNCQHSKLMEPLLYGLVEKVASMHDSATKLSNLPGEKVKWGSYEQLKKKLEHNILYFERIENFDPSLYQEYQWIKDAFREFMKQPPLKEAFRERRHVYIRRCHGDLKTSNIWLGEIENYCPLGQVNILDAIDFNSMYCNIDVLSDIAMLAIDIQSVCMHSHDDRGTHRHKLAKHLANYVTKKYLSVTKQQDKSAKIALKFYLMEKAIVLAIMNLIYDRDECRQLGKYCLDITIECMKELDKQLGTAIVKACRPGTANIWFSKFLIEPIVRTANLVPISNSFLWFHWKRI